MTLKFARHLATACTITAIALSLIPPNVLANNDEELQKLIGTCADCHGPEGDSALPGWLPIANMSKQAIVGKLVGHRAKLVDDSTMAKVAHDLSDEQIDKIATYYSNLEDQN